MIVDELKNLSKYAKIAPGIEKAAAYLAACDPLSLTPGDYEIDGRYVYAFVKDNALEKENMLWEAHRKYADIQLILQGAERIGFVPYNGQPETGPFDEKADCGFFSLEGPGKEITLLPGQFALFLPGELHRPDCPVQGRDVHRRKMVVKVRVGAG